MPATAPIVHDADADPSQDAECRARASAAPSEMPDRVHRLEGEVAELRETIARFAEIVIGEVKGLRQSHTELPPVTGEHSEVPAAGGELPLSRRPWLVVELFRELGTTVRMYLDPRYRVRRATQVLVSLLALLFAGNCLLFRVVFPVEILSPALEKLVDVVLAVLLYKVLSREIVRYRQGIAQLLAWQEYRERTAATVVSPEPAMTRLETE